MLLAVDVGNTDTVFGVWQNDEWTHIFRVRSLMDEGVPHFETKLRLHFLEANLSISEVHTTVLSSVVPPLDAHFAYHVIGALWDAARGGRARSLS